MQEEITERFLPTKDVVRIYKQPPSTLFSWIKLGRINTIKIEGGRGRFGFNRLLDKVDVEECIKNKKTNHRNTDWRRNLKEQYEELPKNGVFLKTKEVATVCHVHQKTVIRWIVLKKLPATRIKINNSWRIRLEDLKTFMGLKEDQEIALDTIRNIIDNDHSLKKGD